MQTVIHRADSRGRAEHGWLSARHSFSFASYYDPTRIHFGKLRVLNDDVIAPAGGFGTHPHDNMEIITIPLSGALKHRDSMGHEQVIRHGEVQVMSAGTGITHSEFNASDSEPVNLLQIWILPQKQDVTPRYGQREFEPSDRHNHFQTLVAPDGHNQSLSVNQDTWFSLGNFDSGETTRYALHGVSNGVYLFVIDGEVSVGNETLQKRDAMGISKTDAVKLTFNTDSQVLLIEVPMH